MLDQRSQTLHEAVQEAMDRLRVPGVAIGILRAGVQETTSFGVTSIENPLPVDADTLFQVGSITKTFTATAVVRLVERGTLQLEAPLRTYLPDLRLADAGVSSKVSLRHLLTHTAGFVGDDFTDTGHGDDAIARYVVGMAELPQVSPLGELFSYCNAGFVLVGRVIEVVTGQPYEKAIRELVLDPLGMANSTFEPGEVMLRRFVVGHINPFEDADGLRIAKPWGLARAAYPAGGLVSSVNDLLRYAQMHLGRGPARLLSDPSRRAMQVPLARAGSLADSVGVAWMLRSVGGVSVVEHGGSTYGQQATLQMVPEHDFALVMLTNCSRGAELHGAIASRLLREQLGLESPEPAPLELPASRLAEYVGRYEQRLSTVDVSAREGRLVLQITPKGGFPVKDSPPASTPPPVAFSFWSEDRIVGLEPPMKGARAEFVRDSSGRIAYLRSGGRLGIRQ